MNEMYTTLAEEKKEEKKSTWRYRLARLDVHESDCAAGFALLNLPKGKSLGRSKPATNS